MNEMSVEEYGCHLREAFEKEHFNGHDGFIFSKSALEDGLSAVEWETIDMEATLNATVMPNLTKKQLRNGLRKSQVVVNILKRCLDGIRIQAIG